MFILAALNELASDPRSRNYRHAALRLVIPDHASLEPQREQAKRADEAKPIRTFRETDRLQHPLTSDDQEHG